MQRLWALGWTKEVDTVYYCRRIPWLKQNVLLRHPKLIGQKHGRCTRDSHAEKEAFTMFAFIQPSPLHGDTGVFYVHSGFLWLAACGVKASLTSIERRARLREN